MAKILGLTTAVIEMLGNYLGIWYGFVVLILLMLFGNTEYNSDFYLS
jgi:hypothetical protein